ncbi:MAG: RagB/SusD family nutrient uptake outer membrane protein [Paludibacter sp.]|nr:RagB/SusD family nutrient uptake outer membrane protein [Paludibacter sp.]
MKKISKILVIMFVTLTSLTGCDSLLDVDSDRLVFADDYKLDAANDTLYSTFAIFSRLQKIADSYVLLGELRGDLVAVTDSADMYLKEIYDWNISSDNPYTDNLKDYYAVINNCNYVIHNIDTSHVTSGEKRMYGYYVAAKAIRAWTYMQIVFNYKTAVYYDDPILTIEQAKATYPEYTFEELAPVLLADLEPWQDYTEPRYFSGMNFPVKFIIGDLYLWLGAYTNNTGYYEKAATAYHNLIVDNKYTMSSSSDGDANGINDDLSYYGVTNSVFNGNISVRSYWLSDYITYLEASNQVEKNLKLDSLVLNRMIAPTAVAINNWATQKYVYDYDVDTIGDLRGILSVSPSKSSIGTDLNADGRNYLFKYITMNGYESSSSVKLIWIYREGLLYLRYAEAVNRLGKPNLAFAALKNGLKEANITNKKIVPVSERDSVLPEYMDFSNDAFKYNVGVHARGCGRIQYDTIDYRIPNYAGNQDPKLDSILYVENKIQEELALEDAFEGNRFQDLMRFSIRRDDNSYLANIVSSKYTDNKEAVKTKLLDRNNWYLK